jgi:hypothetical protein
MEGCIPFRPSLSVGGLFFPALVAAGRRRKVKNRRRLLMFIALLLGLSLLAAWMSGPVRSVSTPVLSTAVYYDTYLAYEPDEAFRLVNVSGAAVNLTGWTVTDGPSEGTITLNGSLDPGQSIWLAREAASFTLEFGFSPDYEYGADTDPTVPNLPRTGSLALANAGDELVLKDDGGTIVDSVVYEGGNPSGAGWSGPTISPYSGDTVGIERFAQSEADVEGFGIKGQILYRKLDQATGLPVPDTDTAADWAQATDDDINDKKVMYPGWDLERYFFTDAFT